MLLLASFLCVLVVANAHVCLISPPQRGSMMGLNTDGADDCFLTTGPCGGRLPGRHEGEGFAAGENVTVTFQKNLDHYNSTNPGYFALNLGQEGGQMQQLVKVPDAGEKSLHLYSLNVTLPMDVHGEPRHVMQVVYHPQNSQAPADFYQCADIMIVKRPPRRHR